MHNIENKVMFLTEQFQNIEVRFLTAPNGKPVVIAADVIEALKGNKTNTADIVKKYVREKWIIDLPNPNGGRPVKCLFEPGVYQLAGNPMFQTDFALSFQDWVFEEVLPKLRASGGYIMPNATSEQLEALQSEISLLQESNKDLQASKEKLKTNILGIHTPDQLLFRISKFIAPNKPNFFELKDDYNKMTKMSKQVFDKLKVSIGLKDVGDCWLHNTDDSTALNETIKACIEVLIDNEQIDSANRIRDKFQID